MNLKINLRSPFNKTIFLAITQMPASYFTFKFSSSFCNDQVKMLMVLLVFFKVTLTNFCNFLVLSLLMILDILLATCKQVFIFFNLLFRLEKKYFIKIATSLVTVLLKITRACVYFVFRKTPLFQAYLKRTNFRVCLLL